MIIKWLCYFTILFAPIGLMAQGSAMLVGGGSENYNGWSDAPYGWFVQKADSGKIINIDVDNASSWYPGYFQWLGAHSSSRALQIPNQAAANDSATYFELISAKGIFIEGGDQWDYVSTWKGTLVEDAIHYVFFNGGVIGGSSAGLAVLGEVVFDARNGSANPKYVAYNPYRSQVQFTDDFLEILPSVFTDSHFHQRGRMGRLIPMLARRIQDHAQPDIVGIGVDVNTALCVEPNLEARVSGEGTVTILYKSDTSHIQVSPNKTPTFTNIHYQQLIHGSRFDLNSKTLIDPGPYLQPVGLPPGVPAYMDASLNGSLTTTADLGEVVITNITTDPLNAWYGNLGQTAGLAIVPQSVIIPKLWNDPNFFENRWVAGMYGVASNPHFTAIYLDDNSISPISAAGIITADRLVYILDTHSVTHVGFNQSLSTNYPGIVNAKIHFLGDSVSYDLAAHQAVVSIENDHILYSAGLPVRVTLYDNYPNPFNPATRISYDLPGPAHVDLRIFDVLGNHVQTLFHGWQNAGSHQIVWRPNDLAAGIYFYRLKTDSGIQTKKCLLIR